jgi:hypothetical protein
LKNQAPTDVCAEEQAMVKKKAGALVWLRKRLATQTG